MISLSIWFSITGTQKPNSVLLYSIFPTFCYNLLNDEFLRHRVVISGWLLLFQTWNLVSWCGTGQCASCHMLPWAPLRVQRTLSEPSTLNSFTFRAPGQDQRVWTDQQEWEGKEMIQVSHYFQLLSGKKVIFHFILRQLLVKKMLTALDLSDTDWEKLHYFDLTLYCFPFSLILTCVRPIDFVVEGQALIWRSWHLCEWN